MVTPCHVPTADSERLSHLPAAAQQERGVSAAHTSSARGQSRMPGTRSKLSSLWVGVCEGHVSSGGKPLPLQETRTDDRPLGEQSCSSLGPTGTALTPQELIPCGRTRLCNLELPPFVCIQQAQNAAPARTLPWKATGTPSHPAWAGGSSQTGTSSPNRRGGSGTHSARQAPSRSTPTQSAELSSQVTQRALLAGLRQD